MPALPPVFWVFLACLATGLVLGCLRIIGNEYQQVVKWHDLRVEVQKLQRQQRQRLDEMQRTEEPPRQAPLQSLVERDADPSDAGDVIVVDEEPALAA